LSRHHETAECGERHGDGDEQQHGQSGAVGRIEPQPVVDADAAVQPHDEQKRALQDGARRPQARQLVEVVVLDAEVHVRDARVDDVRQQQERDEQPEAELEQFPGGKPQRGAPRQLEEPEPDMRHQRQRQHDRAGQGAGHHLAPRLHFVHRPQIHQADRVVEKMRGGEGEQDQAGGDPQALRDAAPKQDVHWIPGPALSHLRWRTA
jgi:hypothetical protein